MTSMMQMEADVQEVLVELKSATTGSVVVYVLREFNGVARDKYFDLVSARQTEKAGETRFKTFENYQAEILPLCVFKGVRLPADSKGIAHPDGSQWASGDAVTLADVVGWPSRVQDALFTRVKEMSGLSKAAVEEAKKE